VVDIKQFVCSKYGVASLLMYVCMTEWRRSNSVGGGSLDFRVCGVVCPRVAVVLGEELDKWLQASGLQKSSNVRAVIAPHAGYSYSGRCAAFAFANIDPQQISRVFLLGPSHHYNTRKCALSTASIYKTPLGDLPIDLEVYQELRATGKFEVMNLSVDEAEHSMEMHLPYLAKVFKGYVCVNPSFS
jgi:AmmeMemoRadiSam system protein B